MVLEFLVYKIKVMSLCRKALKPIMTRQQGPQGIKQNKIIIKTQEDKFVSLYITHWWEN